MSESTDPSDRPDWPDWPADRCRRAGDAGPPDLPVLQPSAPPGDAPQQRPNFCTRCGAPWQPDWAVCPHCADSAAASVCPPRPADSAGPRRPVAAALSLYFTLLAFSTAAMILVLTEAAGEVAADVFISAAHSVVVLLWLIKLLPQVRSGLAEPGPALSYAVAVGLGCATALVAEVTVRFLVATIGIEEMKYSPPLIEAGFGWPMIVVLICVQPAVIEELAFRGAILGVLRDLLGTREAVIVSALMFMILHLAILSFPHLLLVGLALGYLRVRTKSLYPCMVMHFTHNLLVILAEATGI